MDKNLEVPASMAEVDPFVLMDNGNRFYLHVIGITPLSRQQWHSTEDAKHANVV